ncbi:Maltodextrin glucosidase [compost metagenome]
MGLDGNNDPFCRKPFPWNPDHQDLDLLALYQRLGKLRHKSRALRHGGCQVIYAQGDVVVFVRVYQGERVLVAINRGEETAVNLPWEPLLNNKAWTQLEGEASFENHQLSLPEVSVSVWRCQ